MKLGAGLTGGQMSPVSSKAANHQQAHLGEERVQTLYRRHNRYDQGHRQSGEFR